MDLVRESLDNAMDVLNAQEERERQESQARRGSTRIPIGRVEKFFEKIGVAAVKLDEPLMVGDLIEIGSEDDAIRQRVSSMQIEHKDVIEASGGDSVGIKLNYPVREGSKVYKIR